MNDQGERGRPIIVAPREIKIEIPDTSLICPHCKVQSRFIDIGKSVFVHKKGVWSILRCAGHTCNGPVLAIYEWTGGYLEEPGGVGIPTLKSMPAKTYPEMVPTVHESIPKDVAEDYKESLICYNAGAWKATVVLCRRAVQSSVVERGADVNNELWRQIDELASKEVITNDIKDWAHQIRYLGNDGAHPYDRGLLTKVTKDDANEVLKFMDSYLKYVYEMPFEVAKRRRGP